MLDTIKNDDFFKLFNKSQLNKTNTVFWLHSDVTVMFLVISAVIINLNTYVGDNINCFSNNPSANTFSDNFCWIYGTETYEKDEAGESEEVVRYEYYQWIALTLLAQAVFFYLPGWLWSYWEKGHIEEVVGDNGVKVLDDILDKSEGRCKEISEDIASKLVDNMGSHKKWAAKFIFCEVLNFCTTVLQILFTHKFLNEGFLDYGVKVFEYALDPSKENPMDKIFPITTRCTQWQYGTADGLSKTNFLCILSANIWNQKLYLFLSIWWTFLVIAGAVQLIYRLLTFVPQFRNALENWPGRHGFWSDYSDWLFYQFALYNSNQILRKGIREDIKDRVAGVAPKLEEKAGWN